MRSSSASPWVLPEAETIIQTHRSAATDPNYRQITDMSDFRVYKLKRYRLRKKNDDKYTLQSPVDISLMDPETEVPVRQRGGTEDNRVFFVKARELELDESRDRRHNMDAQAKLKRTYSEGLQYGTLVWLVSANVSHSGEQYVYVVSLDDGSCSEVSVSDLLCRPDRMARSNANVVVTLVGPTYTDGKNRRGNELMCQTVIEQQLDAPGIFVRALKKSDVEDKYTHVKKDRCIDLLNMRDRALREAAQQPKMSSWLATVTDVYPAEQSYHDEGINPFGSYWCVRPSKRSRPARPNPFSPPSLSAGSKAPLIPRLRLANLPLKTRCPSPLISSAALARPVHAGHTAASPMAASSAGDVFYFAAHSAGVSNYTISYDARFSDDYQVDGVNPWANPRGHRPAMFWGEQKMSDDRCSKCGSVLTSSGICSADWCGNQN